MAATARRTWRLPSVFARLQDRSILSTLLIDVPPFAISLFVADTLFKFGSFLREAIAFVALWLIVAFSHEQLLLLLRRIWPKLPDPTAPRMIAENSLASRQRPK